MNNKDYYVFFKYIILGRVFQKINLQYVKFSKYLYLILVDIYNYLIFNIKYLKDFLKGVFMGRVLFFFINMDFGSLFLCINVFEIYMMIYM